MLNKKSTLDDILSSTKESKTQKSFNLKDLKDFELQSLYKDIETTQTVRQSIIEEFLSRDPLLLMECINNLNSTYLYGHNSYTKRLMIELINFKNINFSFKIMIIQSLETGNKKNEEECESLYIKAFQMIFEPLEYKRSHDVSTTYFWDVFKKIISKKSFVQKMENGDIVYHDLLKIAYFVIGDPVLEEEFRYKLLQSLAKSEEIYKKFKIDLIGHFLTLKFKEYKYYIFSCQMLVNLEALQDCHLETILTILQTYDLTINGKADISDFFLSLNKDRFERWIQIGKDTLESIQFEVGEAGKLKTIYNNGQNIHRIDVDKSINPFIENLINMDFKETIPNPEDEEEYSKFLGSFIQSVNEFASKNNFKVEEIKAINNSIKRFILDMTLYSQYNVSLLVLLFRSYLFIKTHQYSEELMRRLCEELSEMSDTCTTGHIYRLVNIFSGYEVQMIIPVEDEIKSCVYARLNNIISQKTDDEQFQIWNSIGSVEDQSEGDETEFYRMLGKDVSSLCDELKKEYVEQNIIDEDQLNLYFRRTVSLFQLGERI